MYSEPKGDVSDSFRSSVMHKYPTYRFLIVVRHP